MSFEVFIKIWTDIPPEKRKNPDLTRGVAQILSFYSAIEAWKYVVEHKIIHYSAYTAPMCNRRKLGENDESA